MHFSNVILLAYAASVTGQSISAQKTVANINAITQMSSDLDKQAKAVTLVNGIQTGPEVIQGFQNIVKSANKAYKEMQGSAKLRRRASSYTAAEQKMICSAYTKLVTSQTTLLSDMQDKHLDFEVGTEAHDAAMAMQQTDAALEKIAAELMPEVPSCVSSIKSGKAKMDQMYAMVEGEYMNGLP